MTTQDICIGVAFFPNRRYVANPTDSNAAFHKHGALKMAKVIAVLSPKGGVGKTTIATNLACCIQAEGQRVIIVDTDKSTHSASLWRQQGGEDSVSPQVITIKTPTVKETLVAIKDSFDYIVVDGVATNEQMLVSSVKAADFVLIPVQPSALDFWGMDDLIESIEARQELTDGRPKAAFVVSRQISGTNLAGDIGGLLGQFDEVPTLEARTSQRVAYAEASSAGRGVLEYDPRSKAAEEIRALTEESLTYLNV